MRTPDKTPKQDLIDPDMDAGDQEPTQLPVDPDSNEPLSAEQDVADSLDEVSVHRFDRMPQDGPLNFDDGTDMGHPRGNTARQGGTWKAEGGDSGEIKPPAEQLSDRNGPSDRRPA